jgi:hypothetical protein
MLPRPVGAAEGGAGMKRRITKRKTAQIIAQLNQIVAKSSSGSALEGLTITAACFAGLLDVYSQPNPNNAEGMCDDPQAFRTYFANIIVTTPRLQKKAPTHV